jgi:phospholipase C
VDPPSVASFTGLIHGACLKDRFTTNFVTTDEFYQDAEKGNLPTYSFIEPNLWHNHNDMHPPISMLVPGLAFDAPSALLGGEAFLARIYDAIRSSSSSGGSYWFNTLLMVVFDEHLRPRSSARRKPAGSGWTRGSDGLHLQPARCATAGDRDLALDLRTHGRQRRPPPHVGDPDDARTVEPGQAAHRAGRDRPRPRPVADPRQATSARGLARRLVSPQPVPDFDGSLIPLDAPLSPMAKMWAPLYSPPSSGSSATPPV